MRVIATIRQTENGRYFHWESGTAVLENHKGKTIRRKVFVFFKCRKPTSVPVKISVKEGFRSFYQWKNEEGKIVVMSTLVVQDYEEVNTGDLRKKEMKEVKENATGIKDKDLFSNRGGIVPF